MQPLEPPGEPFPGEAVLAGELGLLESHPLESHAGETDGTDSGGAAAWRAEVASRVSDYRARHKRRIGHPGSLALDFETDGAADGETYAAQASKRATDRLIATHSDAGTGPLPTNGENAFYPKPSITECSPQPELPPETPSSAAPLEFATEFAAGELSPHALARLEELRQAAHSAFDTSYYRRRNLESLSAAAAEAALPAVDFELHPAAGGEACLERYRISDPAPERAEESCAAPGSAPGPAGAEQFAPSDPEAAAQGNLIFFPRPLLEPPLYPKPSREELADPVHPTPRILEVPEDIIPAMQASLFPEIRLDGEEADADAAREPQWEVPLPVAPFLARLEAALVDSVAVAAGGALFAAMAWHTLPGMPHTRTFWTVLSGATVLFWAVYQYLFLLYAGRTLGMSLLELQLRTFDGEAPDWRKRRRRARFLLISAASGMLGNLWALLDRDMLCWHDRVSQTFPTHAPSAEEPTTPELSA